MMGVRGTGIAFAVDELDVRVSIYAAGSDTHTYAGQEIYYHTRWNLRI